MKSENESFFQRGEIMSTSDNRSRLETQDDNDEKKSFYEYIRESQLKCIKDVIIKTGKRKNSRDTYHSKIKINLNPNSYQSPVKLIKSHQNNLKLAHVVNGDVVHLTGLPPQKSVES